MADVAVALRTLRQLAKAPIGKPTEHCSLCAEPIADRHDHLLEIESRQLDCVCRACALLFESGEKRKRVPSRCTFLAGFEMTDAQWDSLRVPVGMAFFSVRSLTGQAAAVYPSPVGPTESLLSLDTWSEIVESNPALEHMRTDVEALLVNRMRGRKDYYLVSIDECYRLVGVVRKYWRGLAGGPNVWEQVELFFEELHQRAGEDPHA